MLLMIEYSMIKYNLQLFSTVLIDVI